MKKKDYSNKILGITIFVLIAIYSIIVTFEAESIKDLMNERDTLERKIERLEATKMSERVDSIKIIEGK